MPVECAHIGSKHHVNESQLIKLTIDKPTMNRRFEGEEGILMHKHITSGLAVATTAAMLISFAACSTPDPAQGGKADSQETHTLLLDWLPNPDHVGIYLAKENGAFKENGIELNVQAPSGTADAAKMVSTGQVDLAISYEPDTIMAASQGMKVISVAAFIPEVLDSLVIAGKDKTVNDLKGKSVGNSALASSVPTMNYILKSHGLREQDVTNVSLSTGLIEPLVNNQVAAVIGAFKNVEAVQLVGEGDYTVLPLDQIGVPSYNELVVIANPDRLNNDEDYAAFVRKCLTALKQGVADAQEHPDDAYEAIKPVAEGYDEALLKKMVQATVPTYENPLGFGQMDADSWDSYADWMLENGLIEQEIAGSDCMTNDYLL